MSQFYSPYISYFRFQMSRAPILKMNQGDSCPNNEPFPCIIRNLLPLSHLLNHFTDVGKFCFSLKSLRSLPLDTEGFSPICRTLQRLIINNRQNVVGSASFSPRTSAHARNCFWQLLSSLRRLVMESGINYSKFNRKLFTALHNTKTVGRFRILAATQFSASVDRNRLFRIVSLVNWFLLWKQ